MSLVDQIQSDIKTALKEKDEKASLVLRSLSAAFKNKEIELGKREEGLSDVEVEAIILSEIKKRKEARQQYEKGGRSDLVEEEMAEEKILEKYAPEQMSEDKLEKIIDDIIEKTEAAGMQDIGKVMKEVMAQVGNNADGSLVSLLVRKKLQ
ncbi:MAG: GatB/YqeY domain-containing protein [Candidatus Spechtbacterales bacterium]